MTAMQRMLRGWRQSSFGGAGNAGSTCPPRPAAPSWRAIPSGIWALGFVSMLMDISSEMIHSLFPVYLVGVFGASSLTVGMIEGLAEATASITKLFSGALSDWLGRRKLLAVIGYGLAALAKPVFPLAATIGWLVAARFVDRVGKGIRGAPRDALVAELSPPELRGASFGLRQSLDTVGAFTGPLLAILFLWLFHARFRPVLWLAVLPAFLSLALIIAAVPEARRPVNAATARMPLRRRELARLDRTYWAAIAIATLFTLARFSEAFLILRARGIDLPVVLVPAVLVIMNIAYAASAFPVGILVDRIDRVALLGIGLLLLIAADTVLAFASGPAALAAGATLWGLHMGFSQGLFATIVADAAPADIRGTAFGVYNLVTGLALLAASVIAGALWDSAGARATFLVGAVFAALTLAALVKLRTRLTRRAAPP